MKNKKLIDIDTSKMAKAWDMTAPHSHSYFEIYFLIEGERKILFADTVLNVPAGAAVVIPPFVVHKTEGGPFFRINLYLSEESLPEFAHRALMRCHERSAVIFSDERLIRVRSILDELLSLSDSVSEDAEEKKYAIASYLCYQLGLAAEECEDAPTEKALPKTVSQAIAIINSHLSERITLHGVAEQLFVSESALCRGFKRHLGCSFGDYVTNLRLSEAKKLLATTDLSVERIAELSGFSSANYMGLVFKNSIGLSPSKYRTKSKKG